VKIIKDPKTEWSIQISCGQCSAVLEIVDTDVYVATLGSGMDDFNHADYYIVDCAICKRFIELDPARLPEWVRRERKTSRSPGP
jgi:hypothetical protein